MAESEKLSLSSTADGVLLKGPPFSSSDPDAESDWEPLALDGSRVLLSRRSHSKLMGDSSGGVARCRVEHFKAVLLGLARDGFSGLISVDTGRGVKKLFFQRGEIVFASSTLIDDRLGEVIYRAEMIDMEQMASSAVQVTREFKFGQVLLKSGIFDAVQLWKALRLQVREIIESVFLVGHVFYHIDDQNLSPPTSVYFASGTERLIEDAASFGRMFKGFLKRITLDSKLEINDHLSDFIVPVEGTFKKDVFDLIHESGLIRDLIKVSKLEDINTYKAIYQLVGSGKCRLVSGVKVAFDATSGRGRLKDLVDAYGILLLNAHKTFQSLGKEVPVVQMRRFAEDLSLPDQPMFYLTEKGELPHESVEGFYSEWDQSGHMRLKIEFYVSALTSFLLQLIMDELPREKSLEIRNSFLQLVS